MSDGMRTRGARARRGGRALAGIVLALVGLGVVPPPRAFATWVVNSEDECVEEWTPTSLVRGPTAVLMSPTTIPRAVAGAVTSMGTLRKESQSGSSVVAGPILVVFWGANGFVEMLVWMIGGLADTVTGGAFAIAPDAATRLSLAPITYEPVAQPPTTDPCGRPLTEAR